MIRRFIKAIGESPLFMSAQERNFRKEVATRKGLRPDEFADTYYPSHPCPNLPASISKTLCVQLGLPAVTPADNIVASFPDLGFDEVVKEVAEELEIPFGQINFSRFDGTVDNLVEEMSRIRMNM